MLSLWVIALLLGGTRGATIPCPGVTDPSTFSSVPLSERPKLAKILQNGYMQSLNQATLPTTIPPGNPVEVSEGFVNRPFRTINASLCHPGFVTPPNEFIRCGRSSSAGFESTNSRTFATLIKEQILLEATVEDELLYPATGSFYNSSYNAWKENVTAFLGSTFNCTEWGYLRISVTSYSCIANTVCQELNPEFVADLASLPTTNDLEPYRAFSEKWGHGMVEGFKLGAASLELGSSVENGTDTRLYMGRAGGRGSLTDTSVYTAEDCEDPEPVKLSYQRWEQFLDDDLYFEFVADEDLPNRSEIRDNFKQLFFTSFSGILTQARDRNLTETECKVIASVDPTSEPTSEPSVESSAQSSAQPTILSTANDASAAHLTSKPHDLWYFFVFCWLFSFEGVALFT